MPLPALRFGLGVLLAAAVDGDAAAAPEGAGPLLHATLTIDDAAAPKPVPSPGRMFGSFFEDFLHAGDGGASRNAEYTPCRIQCT